MNSDTPIEKRLASVMELNEIHSAALKKTDEKLVVLNECLWVLVKEWENHHESTPFGMVYHGCASQIRALIE